LHAKRPDEDHRQPVPHEQVEQLRHG
jgi:hypothetical protein